MNFPKEGKEWKYLGTRYIQHMWVVGRGLVCWDRELFVIMRTYGVRTKHFSDLLMVNITKEDNSVSPYGLMVRLGGDQDK
jgi:hypothetical protein